jgi:abortive infection bacteriophage resistance protein
MRKVPYPKTVLSYDDQLQQLKNRDIIVQNEQKALHLLEVIIYKSANTKSHAP